LPNQSPSYHLQTQTTKANKKDLSSFNITKNIQKRNINSSNFDSLSERQKSLIFLQKTMGNQAVQKMIGAKRNSMASDREEGKPLDSSIKSFMESRFNFSFDKVRIHDSTQADESAKKVGALSFTTGNNIVFGKGNYSPNTILGKRLIAHELVHVIHQSNIAHNENHIFDNKNFIQRQTNSISVASSDNEYEQEANISAIAAVGMHNYKVQPIVVSKRISDNNVIQRDIGDFLLDRIPFVSDLRVALSRAGNVISLILKDPIGFLRNLINAIRQGFSQFSSNILNHLREGFMEWLFGTLQQGGISIPASFDLPSIFGLVLQILGITYDRIRQKAANLIGEKNVSMLERAWTFISTLISKGLGGLWEMAQEYLSDLKDSIVESVKSWVITTIIQQAVPRLVGLFTPAGALVEAVRTIYNVVMFLNQRMAQIRAVVEAVMGSLTNIANGDIGGAANWIEASLARTIPVAISFIANLIGLGGLSDRIRGFIERVQAKVDQTIDRLIAKIIGMIGKIKGGQDKIKPHDAREVMTSNVKSKALNEAKKEIRNKKVSSIEELHQKLSLVFKTYKKEGLKLISIDVDNINNLDIVISASASEPERYVITFAEIFILDNLTDDEKRQLAEALESFTTGKIRSKKTGQLEGIGDKTVALLSFNGRLIHTTFSEENRHAEYHLFESTEWENVLKEANEVASQKGSSRRQTIFVAINRSPCPDCSTKIVTKKIREAHLAHRSLKTFVDFRIAITGAYDPHKETEEKKATTNSNLIEILRSGWEISVLKIYGKISKRGKWLLEILPKIEKREFKTKEEIKKAIKKDIIS